MRTRIHEVTEKHSKFESIAIREIQVPERPLYDLLNFLLDSSQ